MSELVSMETCQETWKDVHGDVAGCLQRRGRMSPETSAYAHGKTPNVTSGTFCIRKLESMNCHC